MAAVEEKGVISLPFWGIFSGIRIKWSKRKYVEAH